MKFKLILIFDCLISMQGLAQIQITESDLPNPGEVWESVDVNSSTIALPSTGANQVWNYTNAMKIHTDSLALYFNAAAQTVGNEYFPQSSLGYTIPLIPDFVFFLSKSSQGLFLDGQYYPESTNAIYNVTSSNPPQMVVPCGLSLGQKITNLSRSVSYDSLSTITTRKNVNYTTDVFTHAGYGTCSTPGFQLVSCLLINHLTIRIDSNFSSQNGLGGPFTFEDVYSYHTHRYLFLKKGPNVLMATLNYDSLSGTVNSASYFRSVATATVPKEKAQNHLTLFPNPATDHIAVQLNEPIRILSISDRQGRTVVEIAHTLGEVDLSSLPAGIYTVRAQTDSRVYIEKLVKE